MRSIGNFHSINSTTRIAFGALCALALGLGFADEAHAQAQYLEHCNGIVLEAEAAGSCKVVETQQCETECVPVAMTTVCSATLTTECESSCTAEAAVECESSCEETCVPECTLQKSEDKDPNCMGICMSDSQQACNETCEGGRCRSQCAHICSSDCRAQCKGDDATEVVCEPVCMTACSGSCAAEAHVDCQLACQADKVVECETQYADGCTEQCETKGAAIFCDGQFVASAEDFDACALDIENAFSVHLEFQLDAEVDAQLDITGTDGKDGAKGKDSTLSCSMTPGAGGQTWPMSFMTVMFGLLLRRRIRRHTA